MTTVEQSDAALRDSIQSTRHGEARWAYPAAIGVGVIAYLAWHFIGKPAGTAPFMFFVMGAMALSWFAGMWPGILVTLLGVVASAAFYLSPAHSFSIQRLEDAVQLAIFATVGIGVSWLNERGRRHEEGLIRANERAGEALDRERAARDAADLAEARATFLAQASDVLASSLDYEATLGAVARLAVPRIADWCGIHVREDDGEVRQLAVAHVDSKKVELAHELGKRHPYNPHESTGVPAVMRTGKSEITREVSDELLERVVSDPDELELVRGLGFRSAMVVPLTARGKVLGAITIVSAESGRLFDDTDQALAEDLARRAAMAIDNARLYREAQRVAAEREAILAHIADGVTIVDADGNITFSNTVAAAGPMGITHEPLVHRLERLTVTTPDGRPIPQNELPLIRALRNQEVVRDAMWKITDAAGSERIMQGSSSPILGDRGELLGAVTISRDITSHWALERQKDDFLSAAAHDLKSPLTTIKGLAQITQRRLAGIEGAERIFDALAKIDGAVDRMDRLVGELLDTTRAELDRPLPLDRRPLDLVDLVRGCAAEYDHLPSRPRIRITANVPQLPMLGDETRLERVLGNLLSNAVKYSPENPEIDITLTEENGDSGHTAVLTVRDRGMGIPATDLPHIFDRFFRAGNVRSTVSGTGIGLAGARRIVEDHGGTIAVESQECVGTTVTVRLPLD